jgi:hypothetical protein
MIADAVAIDAARFKASVEKTQALAEIASEIRILHVKLFMMVLLLRQQTGID